MRLFGKRQRDANSKTPVQAPKKAPEMVPKVAPTQQTTATENQLGDVTERRQQLESDIQTLNDQYSDIRANLKNRLFSEKELLQTHQQQLLKQQVFLQEQVVKANAALKEIQATTSTNATKQQAAAGKVTDLTVQKKTNAAAIEQDSAQITALQKQIQELNEKQNTIAQGLHGERDLDKIVAAFNQQKQLIERLVTQKSQLNFKIAELINHQNQRQITQESLTNALADNQQAVTDLKAAQQKLDADLKQKGEQAAKVTNQLAVVNHQIKEANEQLQDVDTKLTFYFHSAKVIRAFTFSRDRSYYIFSNVLPPLTDLATTSGWQRIDQLFDKLNLRYKMLTTSFDANLGATWRDYQTRQLLPNAGGVVNPYWHLLHRQISMERNVQPVNVDGQWQVTERAGDQPVTLVSPDKQEMAKLTYRRDQSLAAIQYFHNSELYQATVYDTNNRLLATQLVDAHEPGKVASENFYNETGQPVLQKVYLTSGPMYQTLNASGTIQHNYYSDLDFEVEQLKHQLLTNETDSLIIGSESPLFRALLHDPDRHFELIPLVTSETATDLIEQITRKDSPISSVLTVDLATKQFLIDKAERDLKIAVLPPKQVNHGSNKKTNVMTAVELPKLS